MLFKANLHLHTREDPKDKTVVDYTIYEAIDRAQELGFDMLALTCHDKFVWQNKYDDYAKKKNILLIPGIEKTIEGKHVLILNSDKETEKIKTFEDLRNYKENHPQVFVIAPHPFVWDHKSLGKKLVKNINLFDAIELSIFSNHIFDFNKKARKIAEKYKKPVIANSDTHYLNSLERGYAIIEAETKTPLAVFSAIKNKKLENKIKTMNLLTMLWYRIKGIFLILYYYCTSSHLIKRNSSSEKGVNGGGSVINFLS